MSRKTVHAQILNILAELKTKFPNQGIAKHLSEALGEYPNYWGLTDKEFLQVMEKYKFEVENDFILPEQETRQLLDSASSYQKLKEGIEEYEENDPYASEEE